MRKILGPVLLAVLALMSLLFMQHHKDSEPAATPSLTSTTSVSTPVTSRPGSSSPALSTSPARSTSSAAPVSPGGDVEVEGTPVPATATPTPAGTAQAAQWTAAVNLADRFLKAFARPAAGADPAVWWSVVQSYLTTQAAADYAGTAPANVPFTSVTGPGVIVPTDAPDSLVTAVRVPTDAGDYLVEIRSTPEGLRITRVTPLD